MINFWYNYKKIHFSVEAGLVCILSFWLGHFIVQYFYLDYAFLGGFWCSVCAISILHPWTKNSLNEAKKRFYANMLSIILTGILCFFFGIGYFQFSSAIALNILITRLTKFYAGTRIAAIQAGIIVAIGIVLPKLSLYAILVTRFSETVVGILIGLLAVGISSKLGIRIYQKLDSHD